MDNNKIDLNMSDIALSDDNKKTKLIMKLKNLNTARALVFLILKFQEFEFVYTKEVAVALGCAMSHAYRILEDFKTNGLIHKDVINPQFVSWKPVKVIKMRLLDYYPYARKTIEQHKENMKR